MNVEIKITGSGSILDVASQLKQIARDIAEGEALCFNAAGVCEWEDPTLFTTITLKEDELEG